MSVEWDTTINDGLPVIARATLVSPDPSVGMMGWGLEDLELFWYPRGKGLRPVPQKLYDKAEAEDYGRLVEEALSVGPGWL